MSSTPRMWVTGMWGFTPETHGYVGFTNEGARTAYIKNCEPGDLMAVIGQRSAYTEKRDIGRMLGIVELDPVLIHDTDRMSKESYDEKIARGWKDRWVYAMPIVRAWKIGPEIKARYVASITCAPNNARAIGGNALPLCSEEAVKILQLRVRKVAIFGDTDWVADDIGSPEVTARIAVSRGPPPAIGTTSRTLSDGENHLYIMQMQGPVAAIFSQHSLHRMKVIKVGRSNDTRRRENDLNFGFPPGCDVRWKVRATQAFDSADEAHAAEQQLLSILERSGWAVGGEFAIVPERDLDVLFAKVAGKAAFTIKV